MTPVEGLLEEIELADSLGIHVYGIGEHHSDEFLDSAPAVLLSAAAARTRRIRLTSAISVLSASDPVRLFEDFATVDLVSRGRAEIVVGRGAYAEAFSLFGLDLREYDSLFESKLDLLLRLRRGGPIQWSGRHRPSLDGQRVTPKPEQELLPIWVGATGSPESFARAGALGLPLAFGIIGGNFASFRPLIDLYRDAGRRAGHAQNDLKVAVHAIGYLADEKPAAEEEFFPAYKAVFGPIARKMGRPEPSRQFFSQATGPDAALVVGDPDEVLRKFRHINEVLGGVSRICLQMSVGPLARPLRLKSIELLASISPRLADDETLMFEG
ncbi:LLM class flavin-dependent oxidoreductase [Rhizobium sp. CNPSo 4039]|uniref:LLM class flavin-dependent oxidoreductase n=1 Tax=Rhizobium sp. CNPSo 4039 TaxID=3021409 RepID=UPI00254FEDE4|nr:LLM class flavin-dependent oxidoreductase [Rhizobium sp. CNPSo 4039]MDK4716038.1 LLM class flavin-dependent oxidoreductase [Rhizobium sp. CNPSo 4039]